MGLDSAVMKWRGGDGKYAEHCCTNEGGGGVVSVDGPTAVSQWKVGTDTNDGLDCFKDSAVGV